MNFRNILPLPLLLMILLPLGLPGCKVKETGPANIIAPEKLSTAPLELKEPDTPQKETISTQEAEKKESEQDEQVDTSSSTTPTIPYEPQEIKTGLAMSLLIDGSGSMNGLLGSETKVELLRVLLNDLTSQWSTIKDPPIQWTLRTFGSEHPIEKNDCTDTKLLVPLDAMNPDTVREAILEWKAQGVSPLAKALMEAGNDLAKAEKSDRVILLVADGGDACNEDPCAVAQKLYESPNSIITHVIAFDSDDLTLKCIAEKGHGEFVLARTGQELATQLDQTFRSTVPYNLKLKTLVGGSPLPTTLTVYKSGSNQVVQQDQSYGIQLMRLPPGSYDIRMEYGDSFETLKPAKILKGVELTASGKVEQEVRFDLAPVTLSTKGTKGTPVPAKFDFFKSDKNQAVASFQTDGEEKQFYLTPGIYDIVAEKQAPKEQTMVLKEPKVDIALKEGFTKDFLFQTGFLFLKGLTSQKAPTKIQYKITRSGEPEAVITSGTTEEKGKDIELPPGIYDILVESLDSLATIQPRGQLKEIKVSGGDINEQGVTLVSGILHLTAVKGAKAPAAAEFVVTEPTTNTTIATVTAENGETNLALTPGKYNILATYLGTKALEKPTQNLEGVVIQEGKTEDQIIAFDLGILKVISHNLKEQSINGTFSLYKSGTEQLVIEVGPTQTWLSFDLAPGLYDLKVVDNSAKDSLGVDVWLRDIKIEKGKEEVREAVFTNAKIKLIGRGRNNQIIPVQFRIFKYGSDTDLFSGTTGNNWTSYNIPPDSYYIEAGWVDKETDQLLKKWVTLKVEENEIVEKVLRF